MSTAAIKRDLGDAGAFWYPTALGRATVSCCEDWVTSVCQLPPSHAGISTEWPRLDTGNSSVTPWMSAITNACR